MSAIAVISAKGGVGKTTVTSGLASAAWDAEIPSVVVDADPLGHLSHAMGLEANEGGLGRLLSSRKEIPVEELTVLSEWGEPTQVVPAGDLGAGIVDDAGRKKIRSMLTVLRRQAPLVLVDAPAGLGMLTGAILDAVDAVLVVTEPSALGVLAAADTDAAITAAQRGNRRLQHLGMVVNRLPGRGREAAERFTELEGLAGRKLWRPAVPARVVVAEAVADGTPIHAWGVRGAEVAGIFDSYLARLRRAVG